MSQAHTAKKHLFIVAGEASGDQHAADLVHNLMLQFPNKYKFSALGGSYLTAIPEVNVIEDIANRGITGFIEVLKQIPFLKGLFTRTIKNIKLLQPDLIILIDYPGFNLRLARLIKKHTNIKILYYISPQIWAWKAKRINSIKKYIDHMAVIFPFEKEIYKKANIPCTYVGHPLVHNLIKLSPQEAKTKIAIQVGLDSQAPIIALLPGSRYSEIKYHLPVLSDLTQKIKKIYPQMQFILPIAPTLEDEFIQSQNFDTNMIKLTRLPAQLVMQAADIILVSSGTASLEAALLTKPMAVFYKTSLINTVITSKVIRVRYIALCNIVANKMIVPEFLQDDFNVESLTEFVLQAFNNQSYYNKMQLNLKQINYKLSSHSTENSLTQIINNII